MSDHDAFARILASLYQATLDDRHWPVTSALIDEACGITGNCLLVGEGPPDDIRPCSSGCTLGGSARQTWNASTSRSTIPSTKRCRACGNCPIVPIRRSTNGWDRGT